MSSRQSDFRLIYSRPSRSIMSVRVWWRLWGYYCGDPRHLPLGGCIIGCKQRQIEWARLAGCEPSFSKPAGGAWRYDTSGDATAGSWWILGLGDTCNPLAPPVGGTGSASLGLCECLMPSGALRGIRSCVYVGTQSARRGMLRSKRVYAEPN